MLLCCVLTCEYKGGHALVALRTEGADPVHKATIMPRGQSLGMVMQLPEGDQTSMSKRQVYMHLAAVYKLVSVIFTTITSLHTCYTVGGVLKQMVIRIASFVHAA
jgi:Peptidase family M41